MDKREQQRTAFLSHAAQFSATTAFSPYTLAPADLFLFGLLCTPHCPLHRDAESAVSFIFCAAVAIPGSPPNWLRYHPVAPSRSILLNPFSHVHHTINSLRVHGGLTIQRMLMIHVTVTLRRRPRQRCGRGDEGERGFMGA